MEYITRNSILMVFHNYMAIFSALLTPPPLLEILNHRDFKL